MSPTRDVTVLKPRPKPQYRCPWSRVWFLSPVKMDEEQCQTVRRYCSTEVRNPRESSMLMPFCWVWVLLSPGILQHAVSQSLWPSWALSLNVTSFWLHSKTNLMLLQLFLSGAARHNAYLPQAFQVIYAWFEVCFAGFCCKGIVATFQASICLRNAFSHLR